MTTGHCHDYCWLDNPGEHPPLYRCGCGARQSHVIIFVNGLGLTRFNAEKFSLDITDDTVTLTCKVPNTQTHPVIIDPTNTDALGAAFTRRGDGSPTTLWDLAVGGDQ